MSVPPSAVLTAPGVKNEIVKMGFGRPYRLIALLEYLVAEGKIVKVKRIINNAFADVVAKAEIPVLDMASNYTDLSDQLRPPFESVLPAAVC